MAGSELFDTGVAAETTEVVQQRMDEGTVGVHSLVQIREGVTRRMQHFQRILLQFGLPYTTAQADQSSVPPSS